MVVEAGARVVSITILVPSVVSQFDFELTSQGQFHVLVVESKYERLLLQFIANPV
jgi:hypothetical protein